MIVKKQAVSKKKETAFLFAENYGFSRTVSRSSRT